MRPPQYAPAPYKWSRRAAWWPWSLRSPPLSVIVVLLHPYAKYEVRIFRSEDVCGWLSDTALSGLVALTFDLLTSKHGHGSSMRVTNFLLPIFSLLCSSVLDVGHVSDRDPDGQTDDERQCISCSKINCMGIGRTLIHSSISSSAVAAVVVVTVAVAVVVALLRWCSTKRRYINCTYLYLYL